MSFAGRSMLPVIEELACEPNRPNEPTFTAPPPKKLSVPRPVWTLPPSFRFRRLSVSAFPLRSKSELPLTVAVSPPISPVWSKRPIAGAPPEGGGPRTRLPGTADTNIGLFNSNVPSVASVSPV